MKTSFKSFIAEADYRRELSITQAVEFAKQYCTEAMDNAKEKKFLFRGVRRGSEQFMTLDPSVSARRSANTSNHYNLLLSNLLSWAAYPSREKSVICTSDKSYTVTYGACYVVLPRDGAVLGECPSEDLWSSFYASMKVFGIDDMSDFNDAVKSYIDFIFRSYGNRALVAPSPDRNWNSLSEALEIVTGLVLSNKNVIIDDITSASSLFPKVDMLFTREILHGKKFIQVLEDMLDPIRHDFKVQLQTEWNNERPVELWTDSKCLLIAIEEYIDFLDKYNEDNV